MHPAPVQNVREQANRGLRQVQGRNSSKFPQRWFNYARKPQLNTNTVTLHSLGFMNIECQSCNSLHWIDEKLKESPKSSPRFGTCCLQGKVALQLPQRPPLDLFNLFTRQHHLSNEFLRNIQMYNSAFAFTSLGVKIDHAINNGSGRGPYCFKIHGELHHNLGSLCPANVEQNARYAQIYIYDSAQAVDVRMQNNSSGNRNIMLTLQSVLENNPMTACFKNAFAITQ